MPALRCILVVSFLSLPALAADAVWPGFRGTGDSHTAANLPLTWSDTEHLAWTCPLPAVGQSSPVIWKDRVFVTGVQGENKETLVVGCVALDSGKILWQKDFPATQKVKLSGYVSQGAPTPVVDANRVYALFESGDLVALSHDGTHAWTRSLTGDYGEIQGNHGLGSSPAQTDDAVIVLFDHSGKAFLAALDKTNGQTVWKKDREPRVSWSSPIVSDGPQGQEILLSSNGVVQCFTAKDGELKWEVTGLKGNTVASPSVTDEAVLIGSGEAGQNQLIKRGGQGDVSQTHVAWKSATVSSSFGSPLIHDGRAYFVSKAGVAMAVSLADGRDLWTQRLPASTWASPLAAGDRVYFFCTNGETVVAKSGDTFEKLALSKLTIDDKIYGYAIAGDRLVLRSGEKLFCVAP